MVLMLLCGTAVGMVWAGICGVLKVYLGASEIVTTLMLNYVALEIIDYLASGPFASSVGGQTRPIPTSAIFPSLVMGTQFNFVFIMALVAVPAVWFVLWRSSVGFRIRMSGMNPEAAETNGIRTRVVGAWALAASGALAGLAGAAQVGTTFLALPQVFSVQIGYDAIVVSLLGLNDPLFVFPAAILLGSIVQGSSYLQFATGVQGPFVYLLEAVIVLFLVWIPFMITRMRHRRAGRVVDDEFGSGGTELSEDLQQSILAPQLVSERP